MIANKKSNDKHSEGFNTLEDFLNQVLNHFITIGGIMLKFMWIHCIFLFLLISCNKSNSVSPAVNHNIVRPDTNGNIATI